VLKYELFVIILLWQHISAFVGCMIISEYTENTLPRTTLKGLKTSK